MLIICPPSKPILSINDITTGTISFSWVSEDNIAIDHYELYKDNVLLKNTMGSTSYVDNSVVPNEKHLYYVVAIDTSGNRSETSERVSVNAAEDTSAPQIASISCANGIISENNTDIVVRCIDDVALSTFKAEIKASDGLDWIVVHDRNIRQTSVDVKFSVGEYLTSGGIYDIRITLSDFYGNETISEASFEYMPNELISPIITAQTDGCSFEFIWSSASDTRSVIYMVYRVDESGAQKYLGKTAGTKAVDYDVLPVSTYTYYVNACDEYGNTVDGERYEITTGRDNVAPYSYAGVDTQSVAGIECNFDASRSADNYSIQK